MSAVLNFISLKDKNEFLASLGLVEVRKAAVWSKHNCTIVITKRWKRNWKPTKETDARWLYEGTFGADPFQRLTLKLKCFIHVIIMKTFRLKAALNITACKRTFSMHHFSPAKIQSKAIPLKNATLPNCFEFFPSSGPRERWAGGTSWRKTRSKT